MQHAPAFQTNARPSRCARAVVAAAWLIGVAGAAPALAAAPAKPMPSEAQTRYEQERARCLAGDSGQSRETCLTEAAAARDAASKGQLNDGDAAYRKNARERCGALTGDDQRDCIARIKGAPNTRESGSVKGGGVMRESVTREVAPPASAPSAPEPKP